MILLSGFGPFPGVPSNPAEALVRRFTDRASGLSTLTLPTEFAGAAAGLAEAIEAGRPDAVVMLGVAGAGPIRLERLARNASRAGRPDAAGRTQGPGAIDAAAPAAYPSTLPLGALHRALEAAGVPVGWSDDAGGYVCNDLFFRTRHFVEARGLGIPCGFVHVPPAAEADGDGRLTLATMERAVETILGVLARRLAERGGGAEGWRVEVGPSDFADWPALLDLVAASFAPMAGRIDPPSSADALTAEALAGKARAERLLLVRDDAETGGGRPIACAFLRLDPDAAYVGKIAVAPALQGRGLARALLAEAERVAAAAGRPALTLQTRVELTDNHRIFAALGFSRVAETAHPGYDRTTSLTFRKELAGAS
ncbi:Pyrrolidone-carboxylate peptidase (N-terminal pyroglutamyl peptidase) [Tistlia consotensis]|uniref:Pyrrolidone-carboxylate peptidase n=1 Tax=Tistlia consotensis USBA 355 TaxID=560819 RepID=A0A1Y6BI34_9PROT|nr:GNAT family N-acetyltransferase [Tistlia consotensis]SMF12411.1 Pyrrolidone-carboxylate peptidase (N-terminal pyroglutamyl peptidase) [Tistlia consotensis USBA 355]SNR51121.1 Pyrrolidone-carboxylate peptidase (N-terminal pyroglutamyl peptidase) [Tistlia consotensis]